MSNLIDWLMWPLYLTVQQVYQFYEQKYEQLLLNFYIHITIEICFIFTWQQDIPSHDEEDDENDTDEVPYPCQITNFAKAVLWAKHVQPFCRQNDIFDLYVACLEDQLQKQAISVKYKSNKQTNITSFLNKQWIGHMV